MRPAGFVAPLGPVIAVLASGLSLALLANASSRELVQLAIAAVVGVLILFGVRAFSTRHQDGGNSA